MHARNNDSRNEEEEKKTNPIQTAHEFQIRIASPLRGSGSPLIHILRLRTTVTTRVETGIHIGMRVRYRKAHPRSSPSRSSRCFQAVYGVRCIYTCILMCSCVGEVCIRILASGNTCGVLQYVIVQLE